MRDVQYIRGYHEYIGDIMSTLEVSIEIERICFQIYSLVLKSCYYLEKYLSKSKQHGLPDALSNNLSFRSLSVMIYQQFMVSIAELIMLSYYVLKYQNDLAFLSLFQLRSLYHTWLRKFLNF